MGICTKERKGHDSRILIRPGPTDIRHGINDQGLGIRRSGVLPSHARRNGSLPIPCMGCLSHRCSVPS